MTGHGAETAVRPAVGLSSLFDPGGVAVICDSPESSAAALARLRAFPYAGNLWPVTAFANLRERTGQADLAILAVPASSLASWVRECARAGIAAGVAWADGTADADGDSPRIRHELATVCLETGFRLLGPNSMGVVTSGASLAASPVAGLGRLEKLIPGGVSLVTQAGDIGVALLIAAQERGFGFRHVIGVGDEWVLTVSDIVAALIEDSNTRVIAVCIEALRDGPGFVAALERAQALGKPVVVLKAGTAAAAGPAGIDEEQVCQAIFAEHGVISAESHRELLDIALFLDGLEPASLPKGSGVAILTGGGGGGVIAADLCHHGGLKVPTLTAATRERLTPLVPPIASIANPIDLTPEMWTPKWYPNYAQVLDIIASDPNVDTVFFPSVVLTRIAGEIIQAMQDFRRRSDKTVLIAWTMPRPGGLEQFAAAGIYTFAEPGRALRALAKVLKRSAGTSRSAGKPPAMPVAFEWQALSGLSGEAAFARLVAAAGMAMGEHRRAASADEAVAAAGALGYPVAMKARPGGATPRPATTVLDLCAADEVREAHRRLATAGAVLDGLTLRRDVSNQPQLRIVGFRDPVFGPVVGCGAGADIAGIVDDLALMLAPFDAAAALAMLRRLHVVGHALKMDKSADLRIAAECVARFSQLVAAAPWRRFAIVADPVQIGAGAPRVVDGDLFFEKVSA